MRQKLEQSISLVVFLDGVEDQITTDLDEEKKKRSKVRVTKSIQIRPSVKFVTN